MWIVVVVESYYPSVLHFKDRIEAIESYEKNKEQGYVTHLAKVETSHFEEESLPTLRGEEAEPAVEHFQNNAEKLDVEWYGVTR